MREYTEYTREEKEIIVNKGGDAKRELAKAFEDFVRWANLDNDTLAYIGQCDPAIDIFYPYSTKEEITQFVNEEIKNELL